MAADRPVAQLPSLNWTELYITRLHVSSWKSKQQNFPQLPWSGQWLIPITTQQINTQNSPHAGSTGHHWSHGRCSLLTQVRCLEWFAWQYESKLKQTNKNNKTQSKKQKINQKQEKKWKNSNKTHHYCEQTWLTAMPATGSHTYLQEVRVSLVLPLGTVRVVGLTLGTVIVVGLTPRNCESLILS